MVNGHFLPCSSGQNCREVPESVPPELTRYRTGTDPEHRLREDLVKRTDAVPTPERHMAHPGAGTTDRRRTDLGPILGGTGPTPGIPRRGDRHRTDTGRTVGDTGSPPGRPRKADRPRNIHGSNFRCRAARDEYLLFLNFT